MVEEQKHGGQKVVHVKFSGKHRPYLAYKIPYIRIADEDVVMDQDKYNEMLHDRENLSLSWEKQRSRYHVKDINLTTFENYLRKARKVGRISLESDDPTYVLTKLDLLDGDVPLQKASLM